jgi:hypothetical protein
MQQASEGLGLTGKRRHVGFLVSAESRDLMPLCITAILSARLLNRVKRRSFADVRATSAYILRAA